MLYRFLNGWKNFRIIAHRPVGSDAPDNTKTFDFTFKVASFVESYEKQSIRREYLNGKKRKKVFYINMMWEIAYGNHLEGEDLEKFAQIENLETAGWKLELIPHIDVKERKFWVQIIDKKREYGLNPHNRGKKATTHKGYDFALENTEPITLIEFINMNSYIGDTGVRSNPVRIKGN